MNVKGGTPVLQLFNTAVIPQLNPPFQSTYVTLQKVLGLIRIKKKKFLVEKSIINFHNKVPTSQFLGQSLILGVSVIQKSAINFHDNKLPLQIGKAFI